MMEIERKWNVKGWPDAGMVPVKEEYMRQGYVSVKPTVRIRLEQEKGKDPEYIMCLKSKGGMARNELEFPISGADFERIEEFIGLPLIEKTRRTYRMSDGLFLEVNLVDPGLDTSFMYAEVEYGTVEEAEAWTAPAELKEYLSEEVTGVPGSSMGAYWKRTRSGK